MLVKITGLIVWIGISFSAGIFGSQFMPGEWYSALRKPPFNPPGWIFGPVWTVLYVMMGIAAWRVWVPRGFRGAEGAMTLFFVQLALNAAWSWLFFGVQQPGWAYVEILVLWIVIVMTTVAFWQHSALAGWLFVPYLLWVSFASLLNGSLWWLNS